MVKLVIFFVFCSVLALDMKFIGYKETVTAIAIFICLKNIIER